MAARASPDVIVIGAGVVGLTTAVCLAERGARVEVRAREVPGSASVVAPAMIGPVMAPADSEVGRWERVSVLALAELAATARTGVAIRRGRLASRTAKPQPPGYAQPCAKNELPAGFAQGSWAGLPLVEMPIYLGHLIARLTAAHGRIELENVTSLDEIAREVSMVANCSGLGARELAGDRLVFPVRGDHVIVENVGLVEFFVESPDSPEWTAYWPHRDHIVLGGTASVANTTLESDSAAAERIVQRCVEVEPRLRGARVLAHQVGLRATRATPRVELEEIGAARCVHNYGHGAFGVTLSWGCAQMAASLLLDH